MRASWEASHRFDEAPDDPREGQVVVARCFPGRVGRLTGAHEGLHPVPVAQRVEAGLGGKGVGEPGRVRQGVPHRDALLAPGGELQ